MKFDALKKDRFLRRDSNQSDQTKNATYTAANPAPKRGDDTRRKAGRPKGSEEDDGAPNILTGTVITSCFIQTSALPSRIELQGNDLTFFDDTYSENGRVIGDTSRLIFTHGSAKFGEKIEQGFIMEKRASIYNTYDNVLSWFALPAKEGSENYMFIGRNAYGNDEQRNIQSMHFNIDDDLNFEPPGGQPLNGIFEIEFSEDATYVGRVFIAGASRFILGAPYNTGYSAILNGGGGGIAGLGYEGNVGIFMGPNGPVIEGGTLQINGPMAVSIEHITGPGAISVATSATGITTTGLAQAFTLADGVDGQIKYIFIDVDGGSAVITPATSNGYTTITLNGPDDGATLIFSSVAGWQPVGDSGASFA